MAFTSYTLSARKVNFDNGKNSFVSLRISSVILESAASAVVVSSNKRMHENAGRIAVMRESVLYYAERVDNGEDIAGIAVDEMYNKNYELMPMRLLFKQR